MSKKIINANNDSDNPVPRSSNQSADRISSEDCEHSDNVVQIVLNGEQSNFDASDLDDDDFSQELHDRILAIQPERAIFNLENLPNVDPDSAWNLLKFLHQFKALLALFRSGECSFENVFKLALSFFQPGLEFERRVKVLRLAKYTAVIAYPQETDLVAAEIINVAKGRGIQGLTLADLKRELKSLAESTAVDEDPPGEMTGEFDIGDFLADVLPDSPAPRDATVPIGWQLTDEGVETSPGTEDGNSVSISPEPIVIAGKVIDKVKGTISLEIAWKSGEKWKRQIVDRGVIANSRSIVDLASHGFPVNSNNAKQLVQYLADFETANNSLFPETDVTNHLGWHGEAGKELFLLGNLLILPNGKPIKTARNRGKSKAPLVFAGADEGDEQVADGFHWNGQLKDWLDAVEAIANLAKACLAVIASLAAPLLRLFNCPNFVVSYDGPSTLGKSTILFVAASVWGRPGEGREPDLAMFSWHSTQVSTGRRCGVLNHLPYIVDDTRVADPSYVATAVYEFVSGRDKGRGTKTGMARTATWNTVMVSSGESPITSFSTDDGVRARVLQLWGSPFENADREAGQLATRLTTTVLQNYGWAGPLFISYLLKNREKWDQWSEEYHRSIQRYESWADGNPVAHRLAKAFAVLDMAAWLGAEANVLPWDYEDPIEPLWETMITDAAGGDRALRALQHAVCWARSHADEFAGPSQDRTKKQPNRGWAGRWDGAQAITEHYNDEDSLAFFPVRLKEVLDEGGFDYDAVVRSWRDRDWLETDSDGRLQRTMRFNGSNAKFISIRPEAIAEADA